MLSNGSEKLWRHRKEEEFIIFCLVLLVELVLQLAQFDIMLSILHVMALIIKVAGELLSLLSTVG